ncbi:TerB family tellurite resistance protein [Parvularcula sp. LCG005]|uniref:tellurite resistance TerB family protein n=1 Tax=Parvularcula sp. LCG005 TaxID=3078805 RepID=UPI002942AC2D|nr:TerB family tellurite resistance protein [Parvularcula sp. LCG005]WOI54023.1 TerB family tellurite resistance protein [Parvularcula sp. LCG005]
MKKWMDRIFPNSGDGNTQAPSVSPEIGAAGVLVEAAWRDGQYTEVERDIATAAIMKLFLLDNASAARLRQEAEAAQAKASTMMTFAAAARGLPSDKKEALITRLWAIIDSNGSATVPEEHVVRSVIDVLGVPQERGRGLRPAPSVTGKEN